MAVPAYTTDLTDLVDLDTTGGTAVEPASLYTAGRSPEEADGDYPIQGTVHASLVMNTTGKAGVLVPGGAFTWSSGDYMFGWVIWLAPGAIATYAAGGLSMILGSSTSVFNVYWVGGKDFGKYPYGGWQNFAVDPEMTPDENAGTPTAYHYVGAGANVITQVSKGSPLGFDAFRYGRGEIRVAGGSVGDGYADFVDMAAENDVLINKWGLFQAIPGGYQFKGLMYLGYGALTEFVDSNANIVIENTEWVASDFNRIEVHNASSVINWTNVSIASLGTTSKGAFEMIDNATVTLDGCQFTDMDTFIFLSNALVYDTVFRRCEQITAPGCDMDGSSVIESTVVANDSALVWNVATDPDGYLDNMTFTRGALAHHAIEFGLTSPTDITIRGMTNSGFNAAHEQDDSTFHVLRDTGTVTINIIGGVGNFSYKSEGATVIIVISPVTLAVTCRDISTDVLISGAWVLVKVADDTNFPFEASVAIVQSGGTATVTHAGHGLETGDQVEIEGVTNDFRYNGVKTITWASSSTYTYSIDSGAPSPAVGVPIATMVIISEDTVAGIANDTRTYASGSQLIAGKVRQGDDPPYYKNSPISGTIDNQNGLDITTYMVRDS